MIENSQEFLQHWEKANNPFYPDEMKWDRVKINQFLAEYEKQKCFSISFVEFGKSVYHAGENTTELPLMLKKREIPMTLKESFEEFRHKLELEGTKLSDQIIDLFLQNRT